MQLNQYNITFSRLTAHDLEIVRSWRNSELINQWMIFREKISPEQQTEWFKNLDIHSNYYFIVIYEKVKIGLMNIKNINHQDKTAEPGGFIFEQQYLGTHIPALCLLILFDFGFNQLKLLELQGKILQKNTASIQCNLGLGGIITSTHNGICQVVHSRENYMRASSKYRNAARELCNPLESQLSIIDQSR